MKEGYFEDLLELVNLAHCRAISAPSWDHEQNRQEELTTEEANMFRIGVGKLAWALGCRPEMGFAIKELARRLHSPTTSDMMHLKRVLRYVQSSSGAILELSWTALLWKMQTSK